MSLLPSYLGGVATPTTPGIPTLPGYSPLDGGALVFWNPPVDDGNSAILGYTVTLSQSGTLLRTFTLGVTDFVVLSGITNGVSYDVAIVARNAIGAGGGATVSVVSAPAVAGPVVSSIVPAAPTVLDTGAQFVKRDLQIDFTNRRLVLVEGDLVFATAGQAILQDVWLALGFLQGEWFLDETVGVPMFQKILVKGANLEEIKAIYRAKIVSRRGVKTVLALDLVLDRAARTLKVSFRINSDVGALASSRTTRIGG